jgi:hypothetical protein
MIVFFKRYIYLLSLASILVFTNCGGGGGIGNIGNNIANGISDGITNSSEEARKLLKRILSVVGIPQDVITNICQTNNNSDMCEDTSAYKRGEKRVVSQKITEISDGRYIIETEKPCMPILVELNDSDVVYDGGKFFLKFKGVEYGVEEKELSILEAMVDAMYIAPSNVFFIKKLDNNETQNKFYAILYKSFKDNLNTLREWGLNKKQGIRGTLKSMSRKLLRYGIDKKIPDTLNSCSSMVCVDNELDKLHGELLIKYMEAKEIFMTEKDNNEPLFVRAVSCEVRESTLKKTGQRTKFENYDDGFYEVGIKHTYVKIEETVVDVVTGLQWQDDFDASYTRENLEKAEYFCSQLKLLDMDDWRLPEIDELKTLVNYAKTNPAMSEIFESSSSSRYWSSTISQIDTIDAAWYVNFEYGDTSWASIKSKNYVRCVRGSFLKRIKNEVDK